MKDLLRCLHNNLELNHAISEEDEILIKLMHNIDLTLLRSDCKYALRYIKLYRQVSTYCQKEIVTCCDNFDPVNNPNLDVAKHKETVGELKQLRIYVTTIFNKASTEVENL